VSRFMDAFELLKKKNEQHRKLLSAERKSAFPIVINAFFVIALLEFEIIEMLSNGPNTAVAIAIAFLYVFYNFLVLAFCSAFFSNLVLQCATLVVIHLCLAYFWIWQGDKWSVAYIIGLLFVAMTFKSLYESATNKT